MFPFGRSGQDKNCNSWKWSLSHSAVIRMNLVSHLDGKEKKNCTLRWLTKKSLLGSGWNCTLRKWKIVHITEWSDSCEVFERCDQRSDWDFYGRAIPAYGKWSYRIASVTMFVSGKMQKIFLVFLIPCLIRLMVIRQHSSQIYDSERISWTYAYDEVCGCERNIKKYSKQNEGEIPLNRTTCSRFTHYRGNAQRVISFSYFPKTEPGYDEYIEVGEVHIIRQNNSCCYDRVFLVVFIQFSFKITLCKFIQRCFQRAKKVILCSIPYKMMIILLKNPSYIYYF